jgi:hypothetical protein
MKKMAKSRQTNEFGTHIGSWVSKEVYEWLLKMKKEDAVSLSAVIRRLIIKQKKAADEEEK